MQRERIQRKVEGAGSYFAGPKAGLEFIHSGCRTLDLALGGGWVEDRVMNIVGDKSTGKTLLCIEACANFALKHKKGRLRYRESEAAFDQPYAQALGMPVDRIDFGDPLETVEDLFEDLEAVVKGARGPELYICDSLDALSDRAEMLRDMDQGTYGAEKAKKMSQLFRRIIRELERRHVTVMIVSQVRSKIGISFGRSTTRTGGRALDFYASQVLYLAHIGSVVQTVRGTKRPVAIKVKAKVDKNKVGLPFREAEFKIRFGFGIDDAEACVKWLEGVKALKEMTKLPAKDYLDDLADLSYGDYCDELADLHDVVDKHWYSIEKSLMPTRQKYGAQT